jgi:hypothetical protein
MWGFAVASVGDKFSRWTIEEFVTVSNVLCRCECGSKRVLRKYDLSAGRSKSCGCFSRDATIARSLKHGLCKRGEKKHPTYAVWSSMLTRCTNAKREDYQWYGARGIGVCKEWSDFETFRKWAEENGYQKGLQLDRRDNNGNYCPANCRWVTPSVNCLNRRKKRVNKS